MRGLLSRSGAALAALAVFAQGCGQDPFSPPKRPSSAPSTEIPQPSKSDYLVMVTPGVPTDEVQVWGLRAQREANNRQVIFRIMGPAPGQSPSTQSDVIRGAVADGASALIVVPGDSPGLGRALAEAEAKGVPVILIGGTVAPPDGAKPFTAVDHDDFDASARKIVEATLEDATKAGRPVAEGTALVMVDRVTDSSSARRVAALKAAAESAGFRKVAMVPFESTKDDSAKVAVLEAVKANPETAVVLADDSESLLGASKARIELQAKPAIFVGGYSDYGSTKTYQPPKSESCFVEGKFVDLGALAVRAALARLRGEPVDEHTVLASKFTRGQGLVATAADLVKKEFMTKGLRTPDEDASPGKTPYPAPKP